MASSNLLGFESLQVVLSMVESWIMSGAALTLDGEVIDWSKQGS